LNSLRSIISTRSLSCKAGMVVPPYAQGPVLRVTKILLTLCAEIDF
jgi:hypothetical protein